MKKNIFTVGGFVHYIPFEGCEFEDIKFGRIKSLNELDPTTAFVVFHCNDDWDDYKNYTGASTKLVQLRPGWSGEFRGQGFIRSMEKATE